MLRGPNKLGRFHVNFVKGGNFWDFLFALLHAKSILKSDLL